MPFVLPPGATPRDPWAAVGTVIPPPPPPPGEACAPPRELGFSYPLALQRDAHHLHAAHHSDPTPQVHTPPPPPPRPPTESQTLSPVHPRRRATTPRLRRPQTDPDTLSRVLVPHVYSEADAVSIADRYTRALRAVRLTADSEMMRMRDFMHPPAGFFPYVKALCVLLLRRRISKAEIVTDSRDVWDSLWRCLRPLLSSSRRLADRLQSIVVSSVSSDVHSMLEELFAGCHVPPPLRHTSEACSAVAEWVHAFHAKCRLANGVQDYASVRSITGLPQTLVLAGDAGGSAQRLPAPLPPPPPPLPVPRSVAGSPIQRSPRHMQASPRSHLAASPQRRTCAPCVSRAQSAAAAAFTPPQSPLRRPPLVPRESSSGRAACSPCAERRRGPSIAPDGVAAWLCSMNLGQYGTVFAAHEIDADALCLLEERDLADMGIPIGPKRKILQALK
eukprot:TRINITY_DN10554_c0_g1_i1.p1 TRINITY_DN10554_c0_g1~~TRINITY_DN10554_c0_g1_i1.p1  ORF type:complete len:446 (+),score=26.77 TRINITY_DN10554_c0_g1_i1:63-1400(+)